MDVFSSVFLAEILYEFLKTSMAAACIPYLLKRMRILVFIFMIIISPVGSCGCETLFLILKKSHKTEVGRMSGSQ
jgi:hypothetical protein